MARLETKITVNVRDLPEVQETLAQCKELLEAARDVLAADTSFRAQTPGWGKKLDAASVRLRAAVNAIDGVGGPDHG